MATRGSALQRALKYFREADVDEVRVAATLVNEIVSRRVDGPASTPAPKVKRTRTRKAKSSVEYADPIGSETLADA